MKKRQVALAAAICTALTSVGFVGNAFAAEKNDDDLMSFNLAEIVVHGQRYIAGEFVRATSNVGILGEQDAMKSPISTTTICSDPKKLDFYYAAEFRICCVFFMQQN